ncbi:penicillin acylase family protein [Colwellia sp. MSW7]|uniref:Penicillin acylase family protein n=1 Tax=Colwellia maritima TaxID=2912588 RepID=A0ABS9X5Z4_9GAMM|nr:penicillin acylase family protein [Colwellia maritima]MCI2285644.1 penicillin acylase family protein [Colwellia maritima]
MLNKKLIKKIIISILLVSSLVIASVATWIYSQVEGALPILEGKKTVFGLSKSATIERDEQGIVTIKASNRLDVAVATGFVHAQERFFQMDLLRRNSVANYQVYLVMPLLITTSQFAFIGSEKER